jgi:hypothetical protein
MLPSCGCSSQRRLLQQGMVRLCRDVRASSSNLLARKLRLSLGYALQQGYALQGYALQMRSPAQGLRP